jgi:hypothetical protein
MSTHSAVDSPAETHAMLPVGPHSHTSPTPVRRMLGRDAHRGRASGSFLFDNVLVRVLFLSTGPGIRILVFEYL